MDISRFVEWIKLSPRYLLPIFLLTGFLLFAPKGWLGVFGLVGLLEDYRPWFGAAFLLSGALLLSAAITPAWEMVKRKRAESGVLRERQERLHHLSEPEKEILRGYVEGQTKTQYLSMADGVVGGLEAERVLYRASDLGRSVDYFAYNMQPWAWDYLNKHPKLLS